jgi:anti-sigma B factor antagonist
MSTGTPNIVCAISGDLTSTTAPAFRAEIEHKLASSSKDPAHLGMMEIDLKAARMVDSVGLNLLVSIIKQVKDRGGSVRIRIAHPNIQRILTFTRIDKHAEVVLN